VKKQDTLKNQVRIVYLAIGSNLGDRIKNINTAKFKLQLNNIKISKCSSNYETLSWPNPDNPKFINIVVKVKTLLSKKKLLITCNKIEDELGRFRIKKNEPRTCDIDIIDYDKKVCIIEGRNYLNLPHLETTKRNFVLLPLYEISKNWFHPKKNKKIFDLLRDLGVNNLRSIKQL